MPCKVGPISGTLLPTGHNTNYTWDLQVAEVKDISGTNTVTTSTTFDVKDRPVTVATVAAGLTGSEPVPPVTTTYDDATGQSVGSTSTAGSTAVTFDSWGRQLTYTNTVGGVTDSSTNSYDTEGRLTQIVDNKGETKYTYDGVNANNLAERRGLVTKVETRLTGGTWHSSTAAHDPSGALTVERLPGQIIRRSTLDIAGSLTGVTVNGHVAGVADRAWFGWTSQTNGLGQVKREATLPLGAGFNPGAAIPTSDLTYSYDKAGRLTTVKDVRNGQCTTRSYSFDVNGNRTSQTQYNPGTGGVCTSTGGTTITRAYDAADKPVTGGNGAGTYTTDPLGRHTTIPNTDAPTSSAGNITLGYYDTDAARRITQNGTSNTFTLDGAGRRWTQTTTNPAGVTTAVLQRHYADSGDNPTWTEDTRNGTTTTTRYAELASGNLGLTHTTTGTTTTNTLTIASLRGDIATTITIPTSSETQTGTPITTTTNWNDYNEYGQPKQTTTNTPGTTTGIGYGWLGTHQRATLTDTGITLMGARLYNPTTALFTTTDPIFGGNETTYSYPHDPINMVDIDGKFGMAVALVAFGPVGWALLIGSGLITLAAYAYYRRRDIAAGWNVLMRAKARVKINTRVYVKTRKGAINTAKQHARRTGGKYRQPCKSRDHCHVDYYDGKSRVKRTVHYFWRVRPR